MEDTSKTNTLAIVSVVAGILGWTVLPLIGSLVAVITGHMARNEIRQSYAPMPGDGLAVAGLVLGWVPIIAGLISLAVAAFLLLGLVTGSITLFLVGFLFLILAMTVGFA